jgi:dolichol-phosphate mannosyltransferase
VPKRLAIILPTLNEAESIVALVPRIYALAPHATVIVVDHDSPDRTADAVSALCKYYPTLVVIRRIGHRGLADAYLTGYHYVLEHGFEYAIQMDADGSHDPARIPELEKLAGHCDLVVGSRYISTQGRLHCSWRRRVLSDAAHWYVRTWLKIPLSDVTSGFRLLSSRLISRLSAYGLASKGYSVQIETAWIATRYGFRVNELAIDFHARNSGRSKLSLKIVLEALWRVPWLKLRDTPI